MTLDWYEPIGSVLIDTDEAGFTLALTGDFTDTFAQYLATDSTRVVLRLPQDAAVGLMQEVARMIEPWASEAPGPLVGAVG